MKRAELYRVHKKTGNDPKRSRAFVIISRQIAIDSKFSTVICAPIYTTYNGLSTQVEIGVEEGLKHVSSIHCDELVSIPKSLLTDFIGKLSVEKIRELDNSLAIAVGLK